MQNANLKMQKEEVPSGHLSRYFWFINFHFWILIFAFD